MRVTTNMVSDQIVQNLNIDLARLQDLNQQISTGKKISKPSDDPLGSQQVVNLNQAVAGINQYERNSKYVTDWTTASETALNSVTSALNRANTLALQGANDATLTQTDLNTMGDEVNSILNNVLQEANTSQEGKHIFGGYQTLTEPFKATQVNGEVTAVTYAGDTGAEQVEINTGLTVNKNIPGSTVFAPGAGGTDVFASLVNLRDNLRSGNIAGIQTGIADTETARQQVTDQVSLLGNKADALDLANANLASQKIGLSTLQSDLANTDMPDAITKLQTAQNVYTAALESSAKILQQTSLMNFLK
jgi:flagellar hook-associated protein 3 FlgL